MAWSSAATAASPGSSRSTSTRTSAGAASPTTTTQPHSPRATRTGAYSSALSSESVRRRLTHGASSGSLPASDVGHSDSSDTARSSRNESDVSPPSLLSMAFVERRRGWTCDAPSARRLSCTPTTSATAGPSRACCPARCAARRSARGRSQRGPATRRWPASSAASTRRRRATRRCVRGTRTTLCARTTRGAARGPADLRRRSVCARTKCARIVPVPRGGAQMAEPNPGSDTEEMEFESDESEDMTVFISTAENGRTGTIAIERDEAPAVDMLVAGVRHEQWTSLSLRMDPRMLLRYDAFFSAIAHHATLRDVHIDFLSVNTPQRMALSLRNSPLTSLTLERYRPAHKNAVQLAEGLRGNHALRTLAFVDSILSADGAAAILGALAHNSTLEELRFLPRTVHGPEYALLAAVLSAPECAIANLSVRVRSAAAPGALAAGIAQNRSLRRVSLSIFTPAEDVMGAAARHPTITSLEVVSADHTGRNPFVLPADSTLQHLSLTHFHL